jgi:anaerobic magnesium-protoporphyrin IX monomethyl ester cyclase
MQTLLVFPPVADPAHPPLGLASLAGFLTNHGQSVELADLNIDAYNELLSARYLRRCTRRMQATIDALESQDMLAARDLSAYWAMSQNLLSSEFLVARADEARHQLRQAATYVSPKTYAGPASIIRRALEFVSAAHHPAQWTPGGFSMSHESTSSSGVLAASENRRENLFLPFFKRVLRRYRPVHPQVVGISLNYYGQMIPAITLARVVRDRFPGAFVVVGGGLVCFFENRWEVLAPMSHLVDAWIPFEGEKPLLDLLRALESRAGLDSVPGLVRFENGAPIYRPPGAPVTTAEFPRPRFDGLPLDQYLTPEPILPILTSRGCYWARCAFCSHARLYRRQFRKLRTPEVVDTARELYARYGVRCFYFVDEAVPPRFALEFATAIQESKLPYLWFGETRLERYYDEARLKKLFDGGCRMLIFGLESAAPRVLNLMEKGITPEGASRVLHGCAAAGIRAFVMFFTGFPTETREEAESTVRFVEEHRDLIAHVATTRFVLEPQSPIGRSPGRYCVTTMREYPDGDLKTWRQYTVSEGLTSVQAAQLLTEIEGRPALRPPGWFLLSRSHLVFLPAARPTEAPAAVAEHAVDLSQARHLVPRRRAGLVPRTFAFNLDLVRQRIGKDDATPIPRDPSDYVFSPDCERLIEVGPDGIGLLKACNGRFGLEEILAAVGEDSREATLRFLSELELRRFIEWEVQT